MQSGIKRHDATAISTASDVATRSREYIDDLMRTLEELQMKFPAAASGAAGSEAQRAGTELAIGVQGSAETAVQPHGRGTRTAGMYNPFSHILTPEFDGNRYSWSAWSVTSSSLLGTKGCGDAHTETVYPVMLDHCDSDLLSIHTQGTIVQARTEHDILFDAFDGSDTPVFPRVARSQSPSIA